MAMLAGPRRKQKVINLRAKNNEWSNDNNKFGQRMLEKMGWSSGKGLGANENGIVDHVVARYKNDEKGLGFEDKNDQWTKHEDDFNALLANLSNGDNNEEKLHSGVSLEVKSKKSKARIHYHKFTRGKDLSRYSTKDLANIFGKKSLKEEVKVEEIKDDLKTTEQVFTEKGSMADYFKSKLATLKSKRIVAPLSEIERDCDADYSFRGFSGANEDNASENATEDFAFQTFSFYNNAANTNEENKCTDNTVEVEDSQENEKKTKKKKKNKKKGETDMENIVIEVLTEDCDSNVVTEEEKVKKSKQKKYSEAEVVDDLRTIQDEKPKKKKSKKNKIEVTEELVEEHNHVPKKKKKRKNKEEEC